jgi:hypothetical protein
MSQITWITLYIDTMWKGPCYKQYLSNIWALFTRYYPECWAALLGKWGIIDISQKSTLKFGLVWYQNWVMQLSQTHILSNVPLLATFWGALWPDKTIHLGIKGGVKNISLRNHPVYSEKMSQSGNPLWKRPLKQNILH